MANSKRVRARQLRKLYLLLGECCDLGADPVAWRQHLVERLPALFGCQVAVLHEMKVVGPRVRRPFRLKHLALVDSGWPTFSDRRTFDEHVEIGHPEDGPHITPDLLQRRLKTVHWSSNLNGSAWPRSMFFNEYVKFTHFEDGILGHHLVAPGQMRWLLVNRVLGDTPFNQRECRLMSLLNLELARLLGNRLARVGGPTVTDLPPRQRDVLVCLMNGDSEKQVALELGLSYYTVHDYVKLLHARFGVSSRGELLARCRVFWPVLERMAASQNNPPGTGRNGVSNSEPPTDDSTGRALIA